MVGTENRMVNVNGTNMHIAEEGQGPVVLFLHGFPELWYSWRHQILALSSRGYLAIARIYDTEAPANVSSNTCLHIEPGKIEAEIAKAGTTEVLKRILTSRSPVPSCLPKENAFITSPGNPVTSPSWFSEDDLTHCATKFHQKGFSECLKYYRAMDLNWELTAAWTGVQVKVAVEFIVGEVDMVFPTPGIKEYVHNGGFRKDVPFLEEIVMVKDAGHFINQEKAKGINTHIFDFIRKFWYSKIFVPICNAFCFLVI